MENSPRQYITEEQLIAEYLTAQMRSYFIKKLSSEAPSYIELKISELLKYLVLAHYTSGPILFSGEIDELWHLWILQTMQYQELCLALPGKQFIHHSSNDYENNPPDTTSSEAVGKQLSFLASYRHNFGEFTAEAIKFWPCASQVMDAEKLNLDGFNQFLLQFSKENDVQS